MATPAQRRRKSADAAVSATVKSSIVVSRDLHTRWHAAASMRGMTANALAVEVLAEAFRGIVVIDRNRAKTDGSASRGLGVIESDEDAA
jgi:hypothetical protein